MYSAQSSSIVASLLGGRNSSILRPIRSRLATPKYSHAGGVDVDVAALVVGDEDRVERRVEDGAQLLLVLAQNGLGALALERGGDQAGGRPQRVELGRAPAPLGHAVVEADEAPPLAVDEDRDGRDRDDPLRVEHDPLVGEEVAHLAGEQLVALSELARRRASPTSSKHMSCISGLSSSARGSVSDPLEPLARDSPAVVAERRSRTDRPGSPRTHPELLAEGRPPRPASSARRRAVGARG